MTGDVGGWWGECAVKFCEQGKKVVSKHTSEQVICHTGEQAVLVTMLLNRGFFCTGECPKWVHSKVKGPLWEGAFAL